MLFRAHAPGSMMLMGEYAVLHDQHALVAAINKRMFVTLTPRSDHQITICSDRFNQYVTDIFNIEIIAPYQFILAALKKFHTHFKMGFDLKIESEFSDQVGFASSAAVTAAILAVLNEWLAFHFDAIKIIEVGREIIQGVQGRGSGADIAACVLGGIVHYKMQPLLAERISNIFPITVYYSGSKTKTSDALILMKKKYELFPEIFDNIFAAINSCVLQAVAAIKKQEWKMLGNIMNIHQCLLEALDVSTPAIDEIIIFLKAQKNILGAKISGSGLGDCVLGLGDLKDLKTFSFNDARIQHTPVTLTTQGLICEKI